MDEKLLSSIEGNTLSLHETEIILEHGITIGGKSVTEHLEAGAVLGLIEFFLNDTLGLIFPNTVHLPGFSANGQSPA